MGRTTTLLSCGLNPTGGMYKNARAYVLRRAITKAQGKRFNKSRNLLSLGAYVKQLLGDHAKMESL